MMNENVVNLLKTSMWDLATCANGEPNVVPVAFKDITGDGKLVVGDVFLETTLNNIKANNGKIAISVYDPQIWKATRSKALPNMCPRVLSLTLSRPWWRRCSTELPQQREP